MANSENGNIGAAPDGSGSQGSSDSPGQGARTNSGAGSGGYGNTGQGYTGPQAGQGQQPYGGQDGSQPFGQPGQPGAQGGQPYSGQHGQFGQAGQPAQPGQPYGGTPYGGQQPTQQFGQPGAQGGQPYQGQQGQPDQQGQPYPGQPGQPGYPYGPGGFGPGGPGGLGGPGNPGQFGQQPQQNNSGKIIGIVAAVAAVVVLLSIVGVFFLAKSGSETDSTTFDAADSSSSTSPSTDSSSSNLFGSDSLPAYKAGDCIDEEIDLDSSTPTYGSYPEIVDCDDPLAGSEVISVRDSSSSPKCIDEPGASSAIGFESEDIEALCLGAVGADKSKSVNTAKEGDCIGEGSSLYEKVDCGTPGAKKVVAVVQNPSGGEGDVESIPECEAAGHPETDSIYSFAIPSDYDSIDAETPERGLCLVDP